MSPTDRSAYAAAQAEMLAALMRGDGYPEGFVVAQADAAGQSLRRKRARLVRQAWPALGVALGARFDARFDAFARVSQAPAAGGGLVDGYAFARWLRACDDGVRETVLRGDDVRVELLLARALVRRRQRGRAWRRGCFAGVTHLPARRLLVAVRAPALGMRLLALPLPGRAHRSPLT